MLLACILLLPIISFEAFGWRREGSLALFADFTHAASDSLAYLVGFVAAIFSAYLDRVGRTHKEFHLEEIVAALVNLTLLSLAIPLITAKDWLNPAGGALVVPAIIYVLFAKAVRVREALINWWKN